MKKTQFLTIAALVLAALTPVGANAGGSQSIASPGAVLIHALGTTVDGNGLSIATCPRPSQIASGGGSSGTSGGSVGPQASFPYTVAGGRPVGWVVSDDTKLGYSAFVNCIEAK